MNKSSAASAILWGITDMSDSVQIDVISNKLVEDTEVNYWSPGRSFAEYLSERVPAYRPDHSRMFSVTCNGKPWSEASWSNPLDAGDHLVVTIEPMGATVAMLVLTAASAYYSYRMSKNIPDNYNQTSPTGSSIYNVNAQANESKLMGIVPELIGRHKLMPSYLVMPRREWYNHEQHLFLMLCITSGECDLSDGDVYIGGTSVLSLGDDVDVEVFPPGADVSGNPAHRAEYHAEEVSINGAGGIDLAGPIYAEEWSVEDGEFYWQWQIQSSDTLGLWCYVYSGGLLYQGWYGAAGWHDNYNDVHSGSLIGQVVEFYGNGSTTDGLYRALSQWDDGSTVRFEKLNDDLTVDTSWSGFGAIDSFFICRWRLWGGDLSRKHSGPFSAVPANLATNQIRLDFLYLGGLAEQTGGAPDYHASTIEVEWREQGSTTWQKETYIFSDNTLDQRVFTVAINVASARPEVRVSRLSGGKGVTYRDDVRWVALRSEMPTATSYPEWTTMAMRIRASNNLSGTAERKVSVIPTRKLPVLQIDDAGGYSWSEPVATRQLSAAFAHALRECGHGDNAIPLDVLYELQQTWTARGDHFDGVMDSPGKLWEALKRFMAVGYSESTLDYGQVIPVRDEPRTGGLGFQPSNILPGTLKRISQMTGPTQDEYDGVEVEFFSNQTWTSDTVLCLIDDDTGYRPEKVRAFGITDRVKAYQYGMRYRAIKKHRRTIYQFATEMDGLNARFMGRVLIGWDMPNYSQTGMLEDATRLSGDAARWLLTLDLPVTWSVGTHYIGLHKPNGQLSGPYIATPGDGEVEIIIEGDLDFTPDFSGRLERPRYQFGHSDSRWTIPALVLSAKPSGTHRVLITAEVDDPRAYQYDDVVLV